MNVRDKLNKWLQGPRREYAEGLALFELLAGESMKQRYGAFLRGGSEGVHFNLLLSKLQGLAQVISANPLPFQEIMEREFVTFSSAAPSAAAPATSSGSEKVVRIPREGHGVRIVALADLPEEMRLKYERIKAITPLLAKQHADLSHAEGEEAETLADSVCRLDDERRKLWQELDAWADGKGVPEPPKEDSDIVKGMELTRSLKRLRDNIRTSKKSAEKYEAEGNAAAAVKARERQSKYEKELKDLERKIADEEAAT